MANPWRGTFRCRSTLDTFDRWLALFAQTAHDVCPRAAAERFILLSRRIAESLELSNSQGEMLRKGEWYSAEYRNADRA
jgi:hypothetical protein